jgi:hypothetical protein
MRDDVVLEDDDMDLMGREVERWAMDKGEETTRKANAEGEGYRAVG